MEWVKLSFLFHLSYTWVFRYVGLCGLGGVVCTRMSIQWQVCLYNDMVYLQEVTVQVNQCVLYPIVEPFLLSLPKSSCIFLMQLPHKRDHLTSFYICVLSSFVFPPFEALSQLPPTAYGSISRRWSWQHGARLESLTQDMSLNQWNLKVELVPQAQGTLCNAAGQICMCM